MSINTNADIKYNGITPEDIAALRAITGAERCLTGSGISEDYSHDELVGVRRMPDVLIKVETTEEISSIMRFAHGRSIPVVVRGSGTGLAGGAIPVEGGIMIETTRMNKILEFDADNSTVTVQPGVLLMDLSEYVSSRGFFYPP